VDALEQSVVVYQPVFGVDGEIVDLTVLYRNPAGYRFRTEGTYYPGQLCSSYIADPAAFLHQCELAWRGEIVHYTLGSIDTGSHPGMVPLVVEVTLVRSGAEIIAVGTDVSSSCLAIATLQRYSAFLEQVFDAIGEGVFVRNDVGEVIISNARANSVVFGLREGCDGEWESVDADGLLLSPDTYLGMRTLRSGEEYDWVVVELRHRRDGVRRWLSVNTRNAVLPSGERGVVTSFADITNTTEALRTAEDSREQYRRVFADAADGLVTLRLCEGRVDIEMNEAALGILKLSTPPRSTAEAKAAHPELIDERGHVVRPEQGPVARLLRGERVRHEVYHSTIGGESRWLSFSGSCFEMRPGELVAAVWLTDITEERARESVLVAAGTQLTAANGELRQLFRRLAEAGVRERAEVARELHDGPVQSLVALRWELEADGSGFAESCEMVIDQLRSMILDLRPATLDQDGLGAATADLLMRTSSMKYRLEYHELDESMLSSTGRDLGWRVVREGVRNAVRHGGSEATEVVVVLRSEGQILEVSVANDGERPDLVAIAEASRTGHYGLYLLRQGVEAAGGTLELAAGEKGGAVLAVRIPCVT
jgi:PAS domain-containing protein